MNKAELIKAIAEEVAKVIVEHIKDSKELTYGEVMKAVFESDDVKFDETGSWIHIIFKDVHYSFCPVEFWNAPYKKGGE